MYVTCWDWVLSLICPSSVSIQILVSQEPLRGSKADWRCKSILPEVGLPLGQELGWIYPRLGSLPSVRVPTLYSYLNNIPSFSRNGRGSLTTTWVKRYLQTTEIFENPPLSKSMVNVAIQGSLRNLCMLSILCAAQQKRIPNPSSF